jgi:hypothetical protein
VKWQEILVGFNVVASQNMIEIKMGNEEEKCLSLTSKGLVFFIMCFMIISESPITFKFRMLSNLVISNP